jgi:hypothetical protein
MKICLTSQFVTEKVYALLINEVIVSDNEVHNIKSFLHAKFGCFTSTFLVLLGHKKLRTAKEYH